MEDGKESRTLSPPFQTRTLHQCVARQWAAMRKDIISIINEVWDVGLLDSTDQASSVKVGNNLG